VAEAVVFLMSNESVSDTSVRGDGGGSLA